MSECDQCSCLLCPYLLICMRRAIQIPFHHDKSYIRIATELGIFFSPRLDILRFKLSFFLTPVQERHIHPSPSTTMDTFIVAMMSSCQQFLRRFPSETPERRLASRPRLHLTGTRRRGRCGTCSGCCACQNWDRQGSKESETLQQRPCKGVSR